jgi:hypothetical protein
MSLRRCSDHQIVCSNDLALTLQRCPEICVSPGGREVEWQHAESAEDFLDEALSSQGNGRKKTSDS